MMWMTQADLGIHGYSLQDIHDLAVHAIRAGRGSSSEIDWPERLSAAASAIATRLCEAADPPDQKDLMRAAWQASDTVTSDFMRHHGLDRRSQRRGETGVRFARYWVGEPHDPFDQGVVESVALGQVWHRLPAKSQEALTALALHGTYDAAARSLGLSYFGLCNRVRLARLAVFRLWYEGETPPSWRGHDQRVRSYTEPLGATYPCGHERTAENTRTETRMVCGTPRYTHRCRACRNASDRRRRSA